MSSRVLASRAVFTAGHRILPQTLSIKLYYLCTDRKTNSLKDFPHPQASGNEKQDTCPKKINSHRGHIFEIFVVINCKYGGFKCKHF